MSNTASSFLYLSKGRVLLVGNALDNGDHSHHALQITLSMEDRPFVVKHPGGMDEMQCALIKPNYQHRVDITDSWRLLILLDANTEAAKHIATRFLQNEPIASPCKEDIEYCKQRLEAFAHEERPTDEVSTAIDDVVARLTGVDTKQIILDPRVEKAICYIHQAEGSDITADYLADKVCLSRDRLSHLFTKEVGIPIRTYILWYRLSLTGYKIFTNQSLAEAAVEAGFSDAAHFSRAFRKMFGMTPSQIMRRTQSVKLIPDVDFLANR